MQAMSNITLSLDEATHQVARMAAAERGISVSALVRDLLRNLAPELQGERIKRLAETFEWANEGYSASKRLSRDELHDRAA